MTVMLAGIEVSKHGASIRLLSGSQPLSAKLASFYVHKQSAAVIGREYLRDHVAENAPAALVELICASCESSRPLANLSEADLHRTLLRQQKLDFERGHVVKVRGCVLSCTEARLCALAALA